MNSRSILDAVRNENKGINAVKPVSSFFSVSSLLLWEAPKAGVMQRGPAMWGFEDALLAPRRALQPQSLRVLPGAMSQGRGAGQGSRGVAGRGCMPLRDHSPRRT